MGSTAAPPLLGDKRQSIRTERKILPRGLIDETWGENIQFMMTSNVFVFGSLSNASQVKMPSGGLAAGRPRPLRRASPLFSDMKSYLF